MKIDNIAILLVGVVFFTGCMSQKDVMVKKGYSLEYAGGFDDGCHSGKKAGGSLFDQFKKDVNKFTNDSKYALGWSDGFRQCESQQEAAQRQIRMGIELQNLNEQKKYNKAINYKHLSQETLRGIDTSGLKNLK